MTDITAELNQKLTMTRGDTPVWDGATVDPSTGNPKSLIGCHLTFTAKMSYDDAAPVFQKTEVAGITIPTGAGGTFVLGPLLTTDTSGLDNSLTGLVWDLQLVDQIGAITTIASGTLVISPTTTS